MRLIVFSLAISPTPRSEKYATDASKGPNAPSFDHGRLDPKYDHLEEYLMASQAACERYLKDI